MGRMQRNKGRNAEREWVNLMREHLGEHFGLIDKNWNQFEALRHDVTLGPFAVEIKRLAPQTYRPNMLWLEACEQAGVAGLMPLLSVRLDRQNWIHTMSMPDMQRLMDPEMDAQRWHRDVEFTITMPTAAFVYFCREYVPAVARSVTSA